MTVLQNQRGAALITAIVILALLTIIGMAATNTSMLETMIAGTEKSRTEAFYAAEAGIEHLRRNFRDVFVDKNKNKFAASEPPDWDFALIGPDQIAGPGGDNDDAKGITYQTATRWIENGNLAGGYTYDVWVWNNEDGGSAIDDKDGVIYMRSDAQVPNGGTASVEIILRGGASGGSSISGYGAQEGAGAGKSFTSNDVDTVDASFKKQID